MQDLRNRTLHNMMSATHQDNQSHAIIGRGIAPVEILDGEKEPQVKIHPPLIHRKRIVDHAHHESPGVEDTDIQGVRGRDPVGVHDLNVEEGALLKRRKDQDQRGERVNIDHPRIGKGGIPPLHQKRTKSEAHEEVKNKSRTSQPAQAKASEPQQMDPPPLPPPAITPTTDSSGSAAVPAVQHPSAQPIQRQVAQAVPAVIQTAPAIGSAAAHLPMARAVPLHQPQGHTQVAAQPDPKAMPVRHAQGHVSLAQPLPQPLYPPQHHMIAVQPRPAAQQFAAPPGLGDSQQAAQAAHIQQMERQLAALQAQLQLRNTQTQAQSRSTSQSPDGWGWGSQSQDNQWQDHGWYNWGNGRGYQ